MCRIIYPVLRTHKEKQSQVIDDALTQCLMVIDCDLDKIAVGFALHDEEGQGKGKSMDRIKKWSKMLFHAKRPKKTCEHQ